MKQQRETGYEGRDPIDILGSSALEQIHAARIDELYQNELDRSSQQIVRELELQRAAANDPSLLAALHARRPETHLAIPSQEVTGGTHEFASGAIAPPGCDIRFESPPYPNGHPTTEVIGPSVTTASGEGPFNASSELSLPTEGAMSVAVALGTPQLGTVYPGGPPFIIASGLSGEHRVAKASLDQLCCWVPPEAQRAMTAKVAIDVTVGQIGRPIYIVTRGQHPVVITQVIGCVYLSLHSGSLDGGGNAGDNAIASRTFLSRGENGGPEDSPYGSAFNSPDPIRRFSLSAEASLDKDASWLSVHVEARLTARRWWQDEEPNAEDRNGFVLFDLRSPDHPTHDIHPLLEAGGPISIPNMTVKLCAPLQAELTG